MEKRLRRKINKVLDYKKVSTTLGEQYIKYFKKLYIIVFDDEDLYELAKYKLNDEDDERINEFIDNKIKEIING